MFPKESEGGHVENVKDRYLSGVNDMDENNVIVINEHNRLITASNSGLKLWMTTVLIAGELVGGGILTLPKALDQSGVFGFFMVVIFGAMACYAGMRLGTCWEILMERWPEYQEHTRDPYPAIAYRSFGIVAKVITRICVSITLFGGATVFLLLGSQLSQSLSDSGMPYCYWVLIFAALLTPVMWLGTPKDFWPVGLVALLATVITVFIALISLIVVKVKDHEDETVEHSKVKVSTLSLAFGTILFMYGGASTFPTIQNDMRNKKDFSKALLFGFVIILAIYLPTSFVSYFTIGNKAFNVLLRSLSAGPVRKSCEVLIIIHLLLAFFVVINPFCQDVEKLLNVPNRFGWKRIVTRVGVMLGLVFVAESIPHFNYVLNVVGGSSITMLTFVFPCLFYLKLTYSTRTDGPNRKRLWIPLYEMIILGVIIIVGIVGGALSTYNSIVQLTAPGSFLKPCYVNIKSAASE